MIILEIRFNVILVFLRHVFEILKLSKLPSQKKDNAALIAEFDEESNFKRCLFFLNAQKQDGVISGLINFVLSSIEKVNQLFDVEFSKRFIKLLLEKSVTLKLVEEDFDGKIAINIFELLEKIQKQSYILWKSSLMGQSAELPREISKLIIRENFVASERNHKLEISDIDLNKHNAEFKNWLSKWQYRSNSLFKVKTLFARIIRYSLDESGNNLSIRSVRLAVDKNAIGEMELDHMVAQNVNETSIFVFEHVERDFFINGLGNMMPLPKKANIKKSNISLDASFKYYEDAGLGDHFLIKMAKESVNEVVSKDKLYISLILVHLFHLSVVH